MRKKTFKVFLPIAVLGCVVSCSKMTSYQYGYDAHMTKENDIVKGQKTSFTAAHPSAGLDLNWETVRTNGMTAAKRYSYVYAPLPAIITSTTMRRSSRKVNAIVTCTLPYGLLSTRIPWAGSIVR